MVAESDDALMEVFFESGEIPHDKMVAGLHRAFNERKIFPVVLASAIKVVGMRNILDAAVELMPSPAERGPRAGTTPAAGAAESREPSSAAPVSAFVFKTIADPYAGRLSLFRVFSGVLRGDSTVQNAGRGLSERLGTVNLMQGKQLVAVPDITVVTNSIPVADVLYPTAASLHRTVILTGGVRTPSDALVGPFAVSAIRSLNIDQLFLGVHGMSFERGFTTPNFLEAEINQAFVEAARAIFVLTDHTKWDTIGLSTICALSDVDVLITNDALDAEARELIKAEVGELIVVEAGAADEENVDG